ncbi:MAG TPA: glutamine synthetase type III, partial [Oligoflexia bacterium]|nr:glutamine synthetase type III [Oligoflexia bacterium]
TSPFEFTGNKFEFRAVGSSSPISFPITVLNTAVAQAMGETTDLLKKKLKAGRPIDAAILEVVRETLLETKPVRFEGNNYSDDWVREAERRGLPNLKRAPEAMEQLLSPSSKTLFSETGVLREQELHSRYHVMMERHVKKLTIEAETLATMVDTMIVPAALKEQKALGEAIRALTEVTRNADVSEQTTRLGVVSQGINDLLSKRKDLTAMVARVQNLTEEAAKAHMLSGEVATLMSQIRSISDRLEDLVSDEFWPLPKYREMLFIS